MSSTISRRPARGFLGLLALALLALSLALPAAATAASFTARLFAPNHSPKANVRWPITVTANRGATKLSGKVSYRFLFQGQVVSNQPGHSFTHGRYTDKLLFPSRAVGHPLTLRVVVSTKLGTRNLDWAVKVHK